MHILGAQILSLMCLFISMVGMFFLPYCFVNGHPESFESTRYQLGISLANCFSGGVFIATFFVGLMPEVRDLFHDLLNANKIKSEFPITEFVIFLGFLLALAIEQFVLEYKEKRSSTYSSVSSRGPEEYTKHELDTVPNSSKNFTEDSAVDCDNDVGCDNNIFARTALMTSKEDNVGFVDFHSDHSKSHSNHSHTDLKMYLKGETGVRLGMLMVSLGVHSLFEGLALGLQTDVSILVNLVIGVAVHELLVAFAMGVNVSRLQLPKSTTIKLALIFSACIPIGQLLGIIIGCYRTTVAIAASAVLQGLAAGTFIHVTFFEVIPAEFHQPGYRVLKVLSIGLGFTLLLICTVTLENVSSHKS